MTWGVFPGAEVIQPTVVDGEAFLVRRLCSLTLTPAHQLTSLARNRHGRMRPSSSELSGLACTRRPRPSRPRPSAMSSTLSTSVRRVSPAPASQSLPCRFFHSQHRLQRLSRPQPGRHLRSLLRPRTRDFAFLIAQARAGQRRLARQLGHPAPDFHDYHKRASTAHEFQKRVNLAPSSSSQQFPTLMFQQAFIPRDERPFRPQRL